MMLKRHLLGQALAGLALSAVMSGASAQFILNDTGVTTCGKATGSGDPKPPIPCTGTGQDGELGRDVDFPDNVDGSLGFSFAAVCNSGDVAGTGACPATPLLGSKRTQWRCTYDQVTGLLWELKLEGKGPFGKNTRFTNALPGQVGYGTDKDAAGLEASANGIALCGRTDWRVPTARELQSITHYGQPRGLLIDAAWYPNSLGERYWTSTDGNAAASRQPAPNNAWGVDLFDGTMWHTKRTEKNRVRLVAGKPNDPKPPNVPRFKISDDGTEVLDRTTRLIWRHCSEGQAMDMACTGAPTLIAREKVLQQKWAAGWRLPNIKELSSIIDNNSSYPSLDPAVFPNSYEEGSYWTTSFVKDTGYLWFVGIGTGAVIYTRHPTGAVRLVKNAPMP